MSSSELSAPSSPSLSFESSVERVFSRFTGDPSTVVRSLDLLLGLLLAFNRRPEKVFDKSSSTEASSADSSLRGVLNAFGGSGGFILKNIFPSLTVIDGIIVGGRRMTFLKNAKQLFVEREEKAVSQQ